MGRIEAVCISEAKGTIKKDIGSCRIIKDFGLENDAHAGSGRQVSLLSCESVKAFQERAGSLVKLEPGIFGENLLISGISLTSCPTGTRLRCGEVLLELTQIGKTCHSGCEIMKKTGECIMPKEGVFARVLEGGTVRTGDEIVLSDKPDKEEDDTEIPHETQGRSDSVSYSGKKGPGFKAAVITVSDRSYRGEREDKSGPAMEEVLKEAGYEVTGRFLLPDEEDRIAEELIRLCDTEMPDVIFTSGGTGFAKRDRTPEATMKAAERNAPGIAEAVRAYSMKITPRAMLSRAVSVIRGRTLIVNLPGSPKAVRETLSFLIPNLEHGLLILRGEADG